MAREQNTNRKKTTVRSSRKSSSPRSTTAQKKEEQKPTTRQAASKRQARQTGSNAPQKRSPRRSPKKAPEETKQRPAPQSQTSRKIQAPPPPPAELKKEPAPAPPEEKINIKLDQSVAILIDGNNIEMSLHSISKSASSMINFDKLVPALLQNRSLSRLIYFREGKSISQKLADRLQKLFHGSVVPCYKSADIPLSIKAVQVASKVDTIIILSGDADYVELVRHLKHDGIRVEIAAFPATSAEILLSEADYFFPITVEYSFALK
ncbi:MAG TPA: NYN domain-containing protein [Bacteroidetes bacterium]|nr:NYN domain-containing protein [Bacteroidota bacterium]